LHRRSQDHEVDRELRERVSRDREKREKEREAGRREDLDLNEESIGSLIYVECELGVDGDIHREAVGGIHRRLLLCQLEFRSLFVHFGLETLDLFLQILDAVFVVHSLDGAPVGVVLAQERKENRNEE
jgi:hypothetical protein